LVCRYDRAPLTDTDGNFHPLTRKAKRVTNRLMNIPDLTPHEVKKSLTVRIAPSLRKQLEELARRKGVKLSRVVEVALKLVVKDGKSKPA
jgi:hypothetical protein